MRVTLATARLAAACSAAMLLVACEPQAPEMTDLETTRMTDLLANPSPRCVGRYLLDMPQSLVLNSESSTVVERVKIEVKPMARRAFDLALQAREAELRNKHQDGEPDVPHLKLVIPLAAPRVGVVFNRAETTGAADASRALELLAWREGFVVRMQVGARDVDSPVYQNDALYRSDKTNIKEKLTHLLTMFERVRGRQDSELPAETGLCIKDGFVKGPPGDQEETAVVYHLSGAQDVYFRVYSDSGLVQKTTLLERGPGIEAYVELQSGRTLRHGRRLARSGLNLEEWLMALTTDDRIRGTEFNLEVNSKTATATTPLVILELYNGSRIPGPELSSEESAVRPALQKASLTDAEAVALWDMVTSTLRVRPGAL